MTSPSAPANPEAPPVAERSIGAILRELLPFLRPYLGRILLALAFVTAGVLHFVKPEPYLAIMPPWLPAHALLVQLSGLAELAGGIGLLIDRWRRAVSM